MARRSYQKRGLHTLMAKVKVRGLGAIDGRSAAARALLAWRRELEADLGGAEAIMAQMRVVIDLASTTKLLPIRSTGGCWAVRERRGGTQRQARFKRTHQPSRTDHPHRPGAQDGARDGAERGISAHYRAAIERKTPRQVRDLPRGYGARSDL